MKEIPRGIVLLAVGVIVGATLATGTTVAIEAGATATSTTYYACLSSKGALSKVGTTSPTTCAKTSTVINWNSAGPQGIQGVQGIQGPQGPGASSTFANFVPTPKGMSASPTLSLPSGTYVATWDISPTMTGGCSFSSASVSVTPSALGQASALVTVGAGGGSLTAGCGGNGTGQAMLTATPTSQQ